MATLKKLTITVRPGTPWWLFWIPKSSRVISVIADKSDGTRVAWLDEVDVGALDTVVLSFGDDAEESMRAEHQQKLSNCLVG